MNTIEFKKVHKSYDGKHEVIQGLDLVIPSGQRTILLGPSGCGKTTLLRMIAGLESITAGDLYMGGVRVNDMQPGDHNVAMVFQNYALYPHMTVSKNILFGMEIAKVKKEEQQKRLLWALEILGLTPYRDRYPKELSGGQRQRVALCRALVKKSPYFLLDEPLSNLDAQLRTSARAELVKIHGVYEPTFVYVTHDQIEAMTVGQKIVLIYKSVIQQYDTPDNIYNKPNNVFVAKFIGSPSMNVMEVPVDGDSIIIDGIKVKVPPYWRERIGDRSMIKFGVRPEHVILNTTHGDVKLKTDFVENHGNRKCISFKFGKDNFMATTEPEFVFSENLFLNVPWQRVHFFDHESNVNIGYPT